MVPGNGNRSQLPIRQRLSLGLTLGLPGWFRRSAEPIAVLVGLLEQVRHARGARRSKAHRLAGPARLFFRLTTFGAAGAW